MIEFSTDSSKFLTYAVRSRLVCNQEIAKEHTLDILDGRPRDPLDMCRTIACKCGWSKTLHYAALLTTKNPAIRDALWEHVEQINALYNPTLVELASWGWWSGDL